MRTAVITRRWLVKTLMFLALLMAIVAVSVSLICRFFYYNTARSVLSSGYNSMVSRYFSGTTDSDVAFNQAARSYLETFSQRNTVGVWVIDRHGKVVATSDGFRAPDDVQMEDYTAAMQSDTGKAVWTGRTARGEKIMAMTCLLVQNDSATPPALRYMVSMRNVDAQLVRIFLLLVLLGLIAIALSVIPGALYIEKLMRAVRKTTEAADKIAQGEYHTRLEYAEQDEIGALCTAVHNMADEIHAAEQMKNDFVSTVSHELRTPLTAIRGWAETLRLGGAEDAQLMRRGMDVIQKETTRLGGMVEELLDFSRIQGGRLRLNRVRMDVLAELEEAVFTFRERSLREKKTLSYDSGGDPVPMFGDPDRIMQVFVNILDNALKYTPAGGTIRVTTAMQPDERFAITIADTGKGVAPDALPHIKEKFYKADTTVHGSGIGLAVADEIVRLHGGTLEIQSVVDKGTTVTITLPLWETNGGLQDAQD